MKTASWVMLAIILTIVAIPLVTKNQIYQTLLTAPDGLVHEKVINDYKNGVTPNILYPAQAVFGTLLANLSRLNNVSTHFVFTWFMGTVLGVSLWITYYVISELAGQSAGYFAVLLGLFRINSLPMMFSYAIVFGMIEMYILLPLCILFTVKWLTEKKTRYLVSALILMAVFSYLHVSAIYIPYIVGALLAMLLIYKLATHKSVKRFMVAGVSLGAVNLAVSIPFVWQIGRLTKTMVDTIGGFWQSLFDNIYYFVMIDITPLVLLACAGFAVLLFIHRKEITLTDSQKYLLAIFGCVSIVLIGAGMAGSVEWHTRQLIDGSVYLSLFGAVIIGLIWQNRQKFAWVIMPTMLVTGLNVINTGVYWIK